MPAVRATAPTRAGSASARTEPSLASVLVIPTCSRAWARSRGDVERASVPAAASSSSLLPDASGDLGVADHDEVIGDDLDLVQEVRNDSNTVPPWLA